MLDLGLSVGSVKRAVYKYQNMLTRVCQVKMKMPRNSRQPLMNEVPWNVCFSGLFWLLKVLILISRKNVYC